MARNETVAQARLRIEKAQRKCPWCGRRFRSVEDLADHIDEQGEGK